MKNILKSAVLFALLSLSIIGCDIIDDPLKNGAVITPPDTTQVIRKIVIEDFTGHRCKNCPNAAKEIKTLEGIYGEQIIGVAVHAGPSNFTGVSTDYPQDFRTPEGNQIGTFFYGSISGIALPSGMVSRVGYTPSGFAHIKSYGSWPTEVANIASEPADFKIVQTVNYTDADSNISLNITVTALNSMLDDLMFCVQLLESDIVSPQLMPDDTRNADYVHNHVLRTMYTNALGDLLQASPIQEGDIMTKTVQGKIRKSKWVSDNCAVLTYVFNATTYEILQAEITHIKP